MLLLDADAILQEYQQVANMPLLRQDQQMLVVLAQD